MEEGFDTLVPQVAVRGCPEPDKLAKYNHADP
jgi:hypothetical protein